MNDAALIGTALLLGLAGNVHCLGMCGGIMAALGMRSEKPSLLLVCAYNSGRILSYAIIGGVLGGMLASAQMQWPALGPALRIATGILLIAMGVYLAGWANWLAPLELLGQQLWKRLPHPSLANVRNGQYLHAIGTGLLWGWLPCGLVYSALAWASTQGDALHSATLMLAFGVGTLPAMLATGVFSAQLKRYVQHRGFRAATGMLVILFGLWTIAMPLWPAHQHSDMQEHSTPHSHHHHLP